MNRPRSGLNLLGQGDEEEEILFFPESLLWS